MVNLNILFEEEIRGIHPFNSGAFEDEEYVVSFGGHEVFKCIAARADRETQTYQGRGEFARKLKAALAMADKVENLMAKLNSLTD